MLLLQAPQKLPQLAFFLVGHCHRWFADPHNYRQKGAAAALIIAFSTRGFKRSVKWPVNKPFTSHGAGALDRYIVAPVPDLGYTGASLEPLIEETYCMSMQSHLAELEKRHRALEEEINECLTHPAVDDLKIAELKRRKLQVKDEIERLRHHSSASVH